MRKFFLVVRKLVGIKKNLNKVVLDEQNDTIIEPLTEQTIIRQLTYKVSQLDQVGCRLREGRRLIR